LLLLLVFFADATITVWRRGDRQRALIVGGTTTFFGAMVMAQFALVVWGIIQAPLFGSFAYLGIVVALGYQLCDDAVRAADLASELQIGEERFRRVVEAAPSAMIMVNQEGQITLANQQAEKTFGYPREELLGRPIEMLVPERLRSGYRDFRHGYLCHPQARPMGAERRELFGQRKDGSEVPVEIGLSPIHTSNGPLVLASIVDITQRKLAELEAARQRHDLAHLARVTALGELSSSLAHELTHPLTAILSNAQAAQRFLADDDVDLDEVREILNDIVTQDQRAGDVIHSLRLMLKKGELQEHCDDVDLNEVILDVVNLMRSDLINRNVTLDTDLAQKLPAITGDRVQLQQVLLNLALNGCEAMADYNSSERRLLIASQWENGAVRVSVADRGSGIPEEKMQQVFERFFTTKKEGMGLGLSVCRTIIDAHRGKIWATNDAGCGATFHFSLPIVGAGKEAVTTDQLMRVK
jgi:PAS domain S-box-containing protein